MKPYVTTDTIKQLSRRWLKDVAPYNHTEMKLESENAALLVIDMQRFFLEPDAPGFTIGGPAIIPGVQRLIDAFRDEERPVIYTRHVHHPDGRDAGIMGWWWDSMCIEGSRESEIYPDIAPLQDDKVIFKHRYSAFYNTDLEIVLRGLAIEDLIICGVMTNLCCETTARAAYMRDYRVFFLADGTGAVNEEMHTATLKNLSYGFARITTIDEMMKEL
jgi:nicotinamidase-related amidase